jgi:hypothetical protein
MTRQQLDVLLAQVIAARADADASLRTSKAAVRKLAALQRQIELAMVRAMTE